MITDVVEEFADSDLGDERLSGRLSQIAAAVAARPDAPFPSIFPRSAELEAFYRFLRNERVEPGDVLEPHQQATVERAADFETVIAAHDTTEFVFRGDRSNLGRLKQGTAGFLAHVSLLVSPDDLRDPLGVAAIESWSRTGKSATAKRKQGLSYSKARTLKTEQSRWGRQVDEVHKRIGEAAEIVHVMDSEADDYTLICQLVGAQHRFVIRLCYDRCLDVDGSKSAPWRKTKEFLASAETLCTRRVKLAKRRAARGRARVRGQGREERNAALAITACSVVFARPSSVSVELPRSVSVNVVAVTEPHPPSGAEPVEWMLITTEPIDDEQQVLRIVDYYRARWTIEEYFRVLKTGCAYEKRQLESFRTLHAALAIFIPIAWSLFRLRTIGRREDDTPALAVLTPEQLEVLRLRSEKPVPRKMRAHRAMHLIAELGGHIPRNGPPGWEVLGRGYRQLLDLTAAYTLLKRKM